RGADLDRYVTVRQDFEGFRATPREQRKLLGLYDRRSSTAEKYRVYLKSIARFALESLAPISDFASDGIDVANGERFKEVGRIEIAIGAFALAKRNMDVDSGSPLHAAIISRESPTEFNATILGPG